MRCSPFIAPLLALAVATGGQAAWAQKTPAQLGVRIDQSGLDFIRLAALQFIPKRIVLAEKRQPIHDCDNGRKIELAMKDGAVDLAIHDLKLALEGNLLNFSLDLDVVASAAVGLENVITCDTPLYCKARFGIQHLAVSARIMTDGSTQDVNFLTNDLQTELSECAVASIGNDILAATKDILAEVLRWALRSALQSDFLYSIVGVDAEYSVKYKAELAQVRVNPGAYEAYLAVNLEPHGEPAACVPAGVTLALSPVQPTELDMSVISNQQPFGFGISYSLMQQMARVAWHAGLMCIDGSNTPSALDISHLDASEILPGLPPQTRMELVLTTAEPPVIESKNGDVVMSINGLRLALSLFHPTAPAGQVVVDIDAEMIARMSVDPSVGALTMRLVDVNVRRLVVSNGEAMAKSYQIDPARLEVLIRDVVLPMAHDKLAGMPLAKTTLGLQGYYISLQTFISRPEGIYLGLDPVIANVADKTPPATMFRGEAPRWVRAGMARFKVTGRDDETPANLLRFAFRADDGDWSKPSFADEIALPITRGKHHLEVAAVDLNDNRDPKPITAEFTVDRSPPTMILAETPGPIVEGSSLTLAVTATDQESPQLRWAYRLEEALPGEKAHNVEPPPPVAFTDAAQIVVSDLKHDGVYKLTVLVYDEAGNVTSESFGFAVQSAGCSVGGRGAGEAWLLCLVLLGLTRLRRRISCAA